MNTPTVTPGLRGHSLAAFREVQAIVDEGMRAEQNLRDTRRLLGYAVQIFPVNVELADGFAARAANRLATAIGMQR